jgi:hypothetical protein
VSERPAGAQADCGERCAPATQVASPARKLRRQCVNWIRVRTCARADAHPHRRLRTLTEAALPLSFAMS